MGFSEVGVFHVQMMTEVEWPYFPTHQRNSAKPPMLARHLSFLISSIAAREQPKDWSEPTKWNLNTVATGTGAIATIEADWLDALNITLGQARRHTWNQAAETIPSLGLFP